MAEEKQIGWIAHTVGFAATLALIVLSLLVTQLLVPSSRRLPVALVLGAGAVWLMLAYQMNLAEQRSSNRLTMIVPALLILLLVCLVVLDPLTRHTYPQRVLTPPPYAAPR